MIEIKFQGNSIENIIRQIAAFAEKVEVREGVKKNGKSAGGRESDMGKREPK